MKKTLLISFFMSSLIVCAQSVTKIYQHDTSSLSQLYVMPYDMSELMVVSGSGFSSSDHEYFTYSNGTITPLTFNGVDTIVGPPVLGADRIFFKGKINGLGEELVVYDGNSTYFFDFNLGTSSSKPEIISYNNEIFIIANNGVKRQLYLYEGGSNFLQITNQLNSDVIEFLGFRNMDYYYFEEDDSDPLLKTLVVASNTGGNFSYSNLSSFVLNSTNSEVVELNDELYFKNSVYVGGNVIERILQIDPSNVIADYFNNTMNSFFQTLLFKFEGKILTYSTDIANSEVVELTGVGQTAIYADLGAGVGENMFYAIANNNVLYMYNESSVLSIENGTSSQILSMGNGLTYPPILEESDRFYLIENSIGTGNSARIFEINSSSNPVFDAVITDDPSYTMSANAGVRYNGEVVFIFKEIFATEVRSDLYTFQSILGQTEVSLNQISSYPNPLNSGGDLTVFTSEAEDYILSSITGSVIQMGRLTQGENLIDLQECTAGIYLLKTDNSSIRIVIQ